MKIVILNLVITVGMQKLRDVKMKIIEASKVIAQVLSITSIIESRVVSKVCGVMWFSCSPTSTG